ncbi:MAG: 2-amino-4-hydroxy-6-hydroxymethyldihydropteridine diphosphokinase [Alphaproteobacteria bacterium]|nr:2-amino-4-hydroxy-6-hydroxymethyldihydropteridine diphosphokinase [Alphaproteobacteria bacterium]
MTVVYLALGSNLGDRAANLEAAIAALAPAVEVTIRSPVYETEPEYVTDQPAFLNMAVCGDTRLEPEHLLRRLKEIEHDLGRAPTRRYGPRLIDLDIVFFGDRIVDAPGLVIPHPRLAERIFVLKPLSDIAPALKHPATGEAVLDLLEQLGDRTGVKRYVSRSKG